MGGWISVAKALPDDDFQVWVLIEHQEDDTITPMSLLAFRDDGQWYIESPNLAGIYHRYRLGCEVEYWAQCSDEPPPLPDKVYVI